LRSRQTANNIVRKVAEACRLVEEHPYSGRSRSEIRPSLRSIATKPYAVFYRVTNDGVAEVVRVIDGRRDIDEIFAGSAET
jgi:plasmid stabilization system protein ParE